MPRSATSTPAAPAPTRPRPGCSWPRPSWPDGGPREAIATAELARRALRHQGRPGLAALADHVVVRARAALGSQDRRTMRLAVGAADALAEAGLVAEEQDARLTAGLVARHLGDDAIAAGFLDSVRARRRRGPLVERSRAWLAEAIRRLDDGDVRGARRAVDAGLDAVAELQSLMGSTELRGRRGWPRLGTRRARSAPGRGRRRPVGGAGRARPLARGVAGAGRGRAGGRPWRGEGAGRRPGRALAPPWLVWTSRPRPGRTPSRFGAR